MDLDWLLNISQGGFCVNFYKNSCPENAEYFKFTILHIIPTYCRVLKFQNGCDIISPGSLVSSYLFCIYADTRQDSIKTQNLDVNCIPGSGLKKDK